MSRNKVGPSNSFTRFETHEIEQSIPARFGHVVEKYRFRPAVKDKDHELTYEQLNQAANRVARAILDESLTGEEPVALIFDQGTQAIVAILGVLKSASPTSSWTLLFLPIETISYSQIPAPAWC